MKEQAFRSAAYSMLGGNDPANRSRLGGIDPELGLDSRRHRSKAERLSEQAVRKLGMDRSVSSKLGGGHYSPFHSQQSSVLGG